MTTETELAALTARMDAQEKAVDIVRAATMAMPTPAIVQADVNGLRILVAEQRQSSKEAIDKGDKRVDDLKERLDRLEGGTTGIRTLIIIVGIGLAALVAMTDLLSTKSSPIAVAPVVAPVNLGTEP